jgi:predicted DNA-binding protein with PD1-like motif
MKSKQIDDKWVLRFELGDDFNEQLTVWAEANAVESGFFHGLGGAIEVTLAFYSLAEKTYHDKDFAESLEIVSLHGNLSKKDDKLKIHAHGVIADAEYHTHGGHIQRMITGPTLELLFTPLSQQLTRSYDQEIGLDLLDL